MSDKARKTLGRGLKNLLDVETHRQDDVTTRDIQMLPIEKIRVSENNPRKKFVKTAIDELAATIETHGLLQPILVRAEADHFVVISGERRLRALRQLKKKEVPAIVKQVSEKENLEIALIENIQREQLDAIEEAAVYKDLMENFKLTQEEVSVRVGKNRSTIANRVRLLTLPPSIQATIADGLLSEGHLRPLIGIKNVALQEKLVRQIVKDQLNARQVEDLVKSHKIQSEILDESGKTTKKKSSVHKDAVNIRAQEKKLEEYLSTRVKVTHNYKTQKGKIIIEYFSLEDFDRLVEVFKK